MNLKHPLFIPIAVAVIVVLGLALIFTSKFLTNPFSPQDKDSEMTITGRAEGDPVDTTVLPFYNDWIKATFATSGNPYNLDLATDTRLSDSVKTYITDAKTSGNNGVDPVLCQTTIPNRIGTKTVFVVEDKAQIMVVPRGVGRVPERALVDLIPVNGQWQISNISCSSGETAPVREFAFEKEGFLLKGQPPLDPQYWYAVYEENGESGHTAPLTFNETSLCVNKDGEENICDQNWFMNPSAAIIKGDMTETGVIVKRLEFLDK